MLSAQTLVSEVLAASPEVVKIFLAWRVDCVGCSLNRFCTLEEMCRTYGLNLEDVLEKLKAVVKPNFA